MSYPVFWPTNIKPPTTMMRNTVRYALLKSWSDIIFREKKHIKSRTIFAQTNPGKTGETTNPVGSISVGNKKGETTRKRVISQDIQLGWKHHGVGWNYEHLSLQCLGHPIHEGCMGWIGYFTQLIFWLMIHGGKWRWILFMYIIYNMYMSPTWILWVHIPSLT